MGYGGAQCLIMIVHEVEQIEGYYKEITSSQILALCPRNLT